MLTEKEKLQNENVEHKSISDRFLNTPDYSTYCSWIYTYIVFYMNKKDILKPQGNDYFWRKRQNRFMEGRHSGVP